MTQSLTTALFIDAGYLDKLMHSVFADQQGGRKVAMPLDYKRLPQALARQPLLKVFYYYAMPWRSDPPLPAEQAVFDNKQRFVEFLSRQKRWELREGRLERRDDPKRGNIWYEQKRVDVMLAVDLVRLAWKGEITRAVLLTGDSDFIPAVADARAAGVAVTLLHGPGTAHDDLIAACNDARLLVRADLEAIRLA
jgi:uncharacterized LabA/DUF88 family protein